MEVAISARFHIADKAAWLSEIETREPLLGGVFRTESVSDGIAETLDIRRQGVVEDAGRPGWKGAYRRPSGNDYNARMQSAHTL